MRSMSNSIPLSDKGFQDDALYDLVYVALSVLECRT